MLHRHLRQPTIKHLIKLSSADWWCDTVFLNWSGTIILVRAPNRGPDCVNSCPYRSDAVAAANYLLANFEFQVFPQTRGENKPPKGKREGESSRLHTKMASGIPKFAPPLIKSVEGAMLEQLLVWAEMLSFSRLHLLKSFLPSQQGYRQQLP